MSAVVVLRNAVWPILEQQYTQFTVVINLKTIFFLQTLIIVGKAVSSCWNDLLQNTKVFESEHFSYWDEVSHLWVQWQEKSMGNK